MVIFDTKIGENVMQTRQNCEKVVNNKSIYYNGCPVKMCYLCTEFKNTTKQVWNF